MDYKAILNMYSVECAACFTPIAMAYHEYHYRTGHEMCNQCLKKYKNEETLSDHWQRLRADYPAIERAMQ